MAALKTRKFVYPSDDSENNSDNDSDEFSGSSMAPLLKGEKFVGAADCSGYNSNNDSDEFSGSEDEQCDDCGTKFSADYYSVCVGCGNVSCYACFNKALADFDELNGYSSPRDPYTCSRNCLETYNRWVLITDRDICTVDYLHYHS